MSSAVNGTPIFSGRQAQLDQLHGLLLQRRHVLIVGDPGIGKSALLNQVRSRSSLLLCEHTSKLSRIRDDLERQVDCKPTGLSVLERKNQLLSSIKQCGQPLAFDHVAHTTSGIARFIYHLSEHVPVWIVCRSELPHEIGQVWKYLSDFVRLEVGPLKKADARLLIAKAVGTAVLPPDALGHVDALYRLSKGNPRLLEKLLRELSTQEDKMETTFEHGLLALDQRIHEFVEDLSSQPGSTSKTY